MPGPARPRLWLFALWLVLFYATWATLLTTRGLWSTLTEHWGIAVAMAAGSYVAGSTPMGGGTVGFPILVLLFDQPAQLGRDFAFAVQSIGMVSASIFVICRRQPIEWGMLGPALLGSAIGTPLGILFVAPHLPALVIKLLFAVVWASFGLFHLFRLPALIAAQGRAVPAPHFDRIAGLSIGLGCGLTVAAITGVGIDMILYAALVLLRRSDLKVAIPTSVIIMAATSLLGVATKSLTTGFAPGVFENWIAAAPVVILGAPLGALMVEILGRRLTLRIVSVLCLGQFAWTVHEEWHNLGAGGLVASVGLVGALGLLFEGCLRYGCRAHATPPTVAQPLAQRAA